MMMMTFWQIYRLEGQEGQESQRSEGHKGKLGQLGRISQEQRDDKKHFLFPSGEADKIYIQPQQFVLIIIVGWSVLKQCSQ